MFLVPVTIIIICYARIAFKVQTTSRPFRRGIGERHRGGTISVAVRKTSDSHDRVS